MINTLKINYFKSIQELELPCKRVNVFIGEPNTGKTNILEALSLTSENVSERIHDFVRFTIVSDLFFDFDTQKKIEIETDDFQADFVFVPSKGGFKFRINLKGNSQAYNSYSIDLKGQLSSSHLGGIDTGVHFYKFQNLLKFSMNTVDKLAPPFGENLPALLFANPTLKKVISDFFREQGFRLTLKPAENEILLTKEVGDELYSYAYPTVSETIRRIVFMMLAIESNKGETLLFDEPEAHTFPFYTRYIAERIALDHSNQYFITTHNPYLLSSLIAKTPVEELSVGITFLVNYETKVLIVPPNQWEELTDMDIFLNLENLAEA